MALFSRPNSSKTVTTDFIANQFASEIIRPNAECYVTQLNMARTKILHISEISLFLNII